MSAPLENHHDALESIGNAMRDCGVAEISYKGVTVRVGREGSNGEGTQGFCEWVEQNFPKLRTIPSGQPKAGGEKKWEPCPECESTNTVRTTEESGVDMMCLSCDHEWKFKPSPSVCSGHFFRIHPGDENILRCLRCGEEKPKTSTPSAKEPS